MWKTFLDFIYKKEAGPKTRTPVVVHTHAIMSEHPREGTVRSERRPRRVCRDRLPCGKDLFDLSDTPRLVGSTRRTSDTFSCRWLLHHPPDLESELFRHQSPH